MYQTCLFCRRPLGTNDRIEHFPVGRRLAFDARKGRFWVVCTACSRWNLSPLEERWDAIEECERLFRDTRIRVSTDNVGLAHPPGVTLVRIGAPLRPELAAWRYGQQLGRRRTRVGLAMGAGAAAAAVGVVALGPVVLPALTMSAIGVVAFPGLTTIAGAAPVLGALAMKEYVTRDRVVARLASGKRVVTVRARHLEDIQLRMSGDGHAELELLHDRGWASFRGTQALHATTVLLAGANRYGASTGQVREAVGHLEAAGEASAYLSEAATLGSWRHGRVFSLLNAYRGLGALRLSPTECLALEMAMHEESERRALEGELAALAEAWREAEEIARIADDVLVPPDFGLSDESPGHSPA